MIEETNQEPQEIQTDQGNQENQESQESPQEAGILLNQKLQSPPKEEPQPDKNSYSSKKSKTQSNKKTLPIQKRSSSHELPPNQGPPSTQEYRNKMICVGCGKVPFLTVASVIPLKIRSVCHWCKTESIKTFSEFKEQKEIKPEDEEEDQVQGHCLKHKDQKDEFYCSKCKSNYCQKCSEERPQHEKSHKDFIITMSQLPKKEDLESKINEAKEFFQKENNRLLDLCVKKLEKKIEKIKKLFDYYNKANLEVIEFVKILEDNYNPNDYATIKNCMENTNFKMIICGEEKIGKILAYIQKNLILDPIEKKTNYSEPKYTAVLDRTFNIHDDQVRELCLLKDGRIASCSVDKTIKIFKIDSDACDITINEEDIPISLTQFSNKNLAVGFAKGSIKIYKIQEKAYEVVSEIGRHEGCVSKIIELNNESAASCSKDKKIKIWTTELPFKLLKELKGHTGNIVSIIKLKNLDKIVSGSYDKEDPDGDGTIRIWDFNSSSEQAEFVINDVECCSENALFEANENIVLASGAGHTIFVIDAAHGQLQKKYQSLEVPICYASFDGVLLVGGYRGRLLSWDIDEENTPIGIIKAHDSCIFFILPLENNKVLTSSKDKLIRLWDIEEYNNKLQ